MRAVVARPCPGLASATRRSRSEPAVASASAASSSHSSTRPTSLRPVAAATARPLFVARRRGPGPARGRIGDPDASVDGDGDPDDPDSRPPNLLHRVAGALFYLIPWMDVSTLGLGTHQASETRRTRRPARPSREGRPAGGGLSLIHI